MILFFSGCGNSRFVAEELAKTTGDLLQLIDPSDSEPSLSLRDDEPLGIVCPVYSWAVPRVVTAYLQRLNINRPPSYLYLACTCGDSIGNTVERFSKLVSSLGWTLHFAYSFIMPETYVNLKAFKLDTPEGEHRKIDATRQRLPQVAQRILRRENAVDVVKGKLPWFNSHITNALFYKLLITDKKFHVTDECVSCGLCERYCPLRNITMNDGRPHWNGNCTNCMSCYHHCPQNAIHFGNATLGKGQYYFGHNKNA